MGGLLHRADTWWAFLKALLVPIFLHTIYDYPILLAHQGLFDTDILYIYLLLLLYLVTTTMTNLYISNAILICCDHFATSLVETIAGGQHCASSGS